MVVAKYPLDCMHKGALAASARAMIEMQALFGRVATEDVSAQALQILLQFHIVASGAREEL